MNFLVFPVYKGLVGVIHLSESLYNVGVIHLSESLYNVIIKYVHVLFVFL